MRALVILFTILLPLAYSQYNYASNAVTCASPPPGVIESPILIKPSLCAPYGTFELTMADFNLATVDTTNRATILDATTGALLRTYTDATLTVNGTSWQSRNVQFRSKAEHVLYDAANKRDLEIQVEFYNANADPQIAMLSLLVQQVGTTEHAGISNSNNFKILQRTGTGLTLKFGDFSTRLKNKQAEDVYLNIFTYEGTTTYSCAKATWFVSGSELTATSDTIDVIRGPIQLADRTAQANNNEMYNSKTYLANFAYGGGGEVEVMRLCYTGYFKNYISDNYGLWFGVGTILLFFIFTLSLGDKPIRAYDYVENVWTHHPLYSIYKYGNEIHTRKTRAALVLSMITINALFASVFYRDASDPGKSSNTIVFAIYAMLIDFVVTFFIGNILRSYYEAKYEFHKNKDEAWDQKAQNRIFGFYFSIFVVVVVGWSFTTWNMGELHPELDEQPSKLWVASLFIAMGMELIVFYPLACILAGRSNFIRRIARSVGFMYDKKICHETYLDFIKSD